MILYINDLAIARLLQEAEWDDLVETVLGQADPPININVKMLAYQLFQEAGEPVPANAVFEPKVWRRDDDPARVAITTTPGERPGA